MDIVHNYYDYYVIVLKPSANANRVDLSDTTLGTKVLAG